MSNSRLPQVWFGIVAIVAGFAVLFSGIFTSSPAAHASDQGITIKVVHAAPGS